jgi:hypothetical protein
MDPNATVRMLLDGCTDPTPAALRAALNGWIARGGFSPRVALHPACDFWMRGAKYATVVGAYRGGFKVRLEVGGQVGNGIRRVRTADVTEVL